MDSDLESIKSLTLSGVSSRISTKRTSESSSKIVTCIISISLLILFIILALLVSLLWSDPRSGSGSTNFEEDNDAILLLDSSTAKRGKNSQPENGQDFIVLIFEN